MWGGILGKVQLMKAQKRKNKKSKKKNKENMNLQEYTVYFSTIFLLRTCLPSGLWSEIFSIYRDNIQDNLYLKEAFI